MTDSTPLYRVDNSEKTAKFLVTGDLHWRGVSPRSRLDNIQEALTRKMLEVYDLAYQYRAHAILQPGDITDSAGISLSTLGDLMELLSKAPCPVISIPGNHDLAGANATSLPRTPFGLLARSGHLYNAAYQPAVFHKPFEIAITGHGYDFETDIDKNQYCYTGAIPGLKDIDNYVNIHMAHGMLLERSPGFSMKHTTLAEVALLPNPPQVLICGHDHSGFGIKQVGNTLCINPGALCRLSASVTEMERPVQVALLEVSASSARAELIPLKSVRPGVEVLTREHLDAETVREENMGAFIGLLAGEGEFRFLEMREIIADIARREKIPEAVARDALDRLARAREELGSVG